MKYFDVHDIPKGFLRARFKTASARETMHLGYLFTPVAGILFKKATQREQSIMGVTSEDEKDGKSSFINTIIPVAFVPDSIEELDFGFLCKNEEEKQLLQCDQRRINNLNNPKMHILSEKLKEKSAIQMIEWIKEDPRNKKANMLWHFTKQPNEDRHIDFYCTDEIAAMAETQQFLNKAKEFIIRQP